MELYIKIILFLLSYARGTEEINFTKANDHPDTFNESRVTYNKSEKSNIIDVHSDAIEEIDEANLTDVTQEQNPIKSFYDILKLPVEKILSSQKVNTVLHNIGTCMVNGVMEIVAYYLPAPLIPLIATAAGMVIPFEPVVMLRRRMPVTSYRRAFKTAVNGFLNTFDTYKVDNYYEDPYMTRRFNRRFMNEGSKEIKKDDT
ncbi:uncharacterized protein LOC116775769 [Danaus plexippus]|uniref:Uncharacterized protein n=1 Tax=Danaus plexippus plexippus TaxID=278856 RepID=A0A212F347_DANPL|nr:uncharacterized protein LOC116775769 [Danaus plexippus]OWR48160.1 hypothetical protein KGM_202422 [Danaus plexippus plexippus]